MKRFEDVLGAAAKEAGGESPPRGPRVMMLMGMLNWTYSWFRDKGPMSLDEYSELLTETTIASLLAPPKGQKRKAKGTASSKS